MDLSLSSGVTFENGKLRKVHLRFLRGSTSRDINPEMSRMFRIMGLYPRDVALLDQECENVTPMSNTRRR